MAWRGCGRNARLGVTRTQPVNAGKMASMTEQPMSVPAARVPDPGLGTVLLLDVREPDEWAQGHAPGAVHIPMEDVPARIGELDLDAELYVVCRQGGRSLVITQYLQSIGIDAVNVAGGMVAWQQAGRELIADQGEAKIY